MLAAQEGNTETVQALLPYINDTAQLDVTLSASDNEETIQAIQARIDELNKPEAAGGRK
jgi:hypothetical protein